MEDASVFSGVTKVDDQGPESSSPDRHVLEVQGWAWAGGGRGIARVDVTADEGKTWTTARWVLTLFILAPGFDC